MSLLWLTVCFALVVMQPAFVQPPVLNARVAGRVIDRVSGTPVTGAVVMLLPDGQPFPLPQSRRRRRSPTGAGIS